MVYFSVCKATGEKKGGEKGVGDGNLFLLGWRGGMGEEGRGVGEE